MIEILEKLITWRKKKSGDWIPFGILVAGSDCGKIQQMLDKINQTILYI